MDSSYMCERYILNDNELIDVFHMLDLDNDGLLGRSEIAALLRMTHTEPTRRELDFIFEEVDTDRNGKIDEESFVTFMKNPENKKITISEMEHHFDKYVDHKSGEISFESVKKILNELGCNHNCEHLSHTFEAADCNRDGYIDFSEFVKVMRRIRFCC
uniref:EF hand n=1 Tax=Rhabditophanes sp. KR3021 TaxID=114890 RepID=A0AC35TU75_9BILA